jgi:energy-coupling factor transporter ATP-binding protein EcfA2
VEKKGRVRPTHDNAIVLKGLNLTVSSGELVLVVGPVGSGKSTLLAALLGLVSPVPRGRGGGRLGGFSEYLGEGDNGPRSPPPPSSHGSPRSHPPLTRPHTHPHGAFLRDAWGSLKPAAAAVLGGRHQLRAAFASQRPWIQNTSLRGNVLFGLPFHGATYRRVIQVRSR